MLKASSINLNLNKFRITIHKNSIIHKNEFYPTPHLFVFITCNSLIRTPRLSICNFTYQKTCDLK